MLVVTSAAAQREKAQLALCAPGSIVRVCAFSVSLATFVLLIVPFCCGKLWKFRAAAAPNTVKPARRAGWLPLSLPFCNGEALMIRAAAVPHI